ncbi:hypothetical protein GGR55DRAFT_308538 [Xylaria sp. FL0064]|nr:hypothetical protein GGR55DRAFT_308538 [Xylaria sp. FL0064]
MIQRCSYLWIPALQMLIMLVDMLLLGRSCEIRNYRICQLVFTGMSACLFLLLLSTEYLANSMTWMNSVVCVIIFAMQSCPCLEGTAMCSTVR